MNKFQDGTYDACTCVRISGMQKHWLPTFYSGDWESRSLLTTIPASFVPPNVKPRLAPLVRSLPVVTLYIYRPEPELLWWKRSLGHLFKHEDDAWNLQHIYVKKCINVKGCLYLVPFLSNFIIYTSSYSSSTINNLYSSPSSSPTHSAIICHFCPLSSTASRSHSPTPSPLFFHLHLRLLLIASLVPPSIFSPSRRLIYPFPSLHLSPHRSVSDREDSRCRASRPGEMVFLSICPSACLPNRLSVRIA